MTRMFTLKKLLFYIMVSLALQISLVGQVTNSIETQIKMDLIANPFLIWMR